MTIESLFPAVEGFKPQRVYAGLDKKAIKWCPGRTVVRRALPERYLTGYTGRMYPVDAETMDSPCYVGLVFVDIDDKHQTREDWRVRVRDAAPLYYGVRTSTSGRGIHLVARMVCPILFEGEGYKEFVRRVNKPVCDALIAAGVVVDKSTSTVYYTDGAMQAWVRFPEGHAPMPCGNVTDTPVKSYDVPEVYFDERLNRVLAFAGWQGTAKVDVVSRDIVPLIESVFGHKVATRSTMSRGDKNGFLLVERDKLSLYLSADQGFAWSWTDFNKNLY